MRRGWARPARQASHCYGRRSIERRSMPAAAAAASFRPLMSFRHFCGDHASVIGAESARLRSIEHGYMTPLMLSFVVCCLSTLPRSPRPSNRRHNSTATHFGGAYRLFLLQGQQSFSCTAGYTVHTWYYSFRSLSSLLRPLIDLT